MELLTSTQLLEHAGSRRKAEGLLREGRWWRVVRGAYAPVGRADDVATRAAAYRLVVPPRTAASHRAALWLLGLDVLDEGHAGRTDFHLRGVVLEYDGRAERLKKPVFVAERRRQTRMAETGLEVRRFTSDDVFARPAAAVCAEVMRAVAQAAGRGRSRLRTGPDTLRPPRPRRLPTLADRTARAD